MIATLRQRSFGLLWLGGLISLTGDWMLTVALPVYVYTLTSSVLDTSLMLVASFVPNTALGSLAGVFVDRWDRKRTMIVADLLLAFGLLPLLLVRAASSLPVVYAVAFAESCLAQFFRPAERALLPTLVTDEYLVPANALSGLNNNLSRLVGPALGGLVIGLMGLPGVIYADAASFLISALLIACIAPGTHPRHAARQARAPEALTVPTPDRQACNTHTASLLRVPGEWLDGMRLVRHERMLSTLFLMGILQGLGEGIFGVLIVVFVVRVLRGGALQLGWLMSAQAVGGLLGGALVGALGKRLRPARALGWCTLVFGLVDLVIVDCPALLRYGGPLARDLPTVAGIAPVTLVVILLFVVVGVPGAGAQAAISTLVQVTVPERFMGRVFGMYFALLSVMGLVGMGLAGTLGDALGPVLLLNVQGSMYAVAGLLALVRLRDKRTRAGRTPRASSAPVGQDAE